jgi:hypothetical protein
LISVAVMLARFAQQVYEDGHRLISELGGQVRG